MSMALRHANSSSSSGLAARRSAMLRAVTATAAAILAVAAPADEARGQASYRATNQWSPNRYLPGVRRPESIGRQRESRIPDRATEPVNPPSSGASLTAAEVYVEEADGKGGVRLRPSQDAFEERRAIMGMYDDQGLKDWTVQWLPDGLVYRSYLAGVKEPRLATTFDSDDDQGGLWDFTFGGRVGIVRFGTDDPVRPEGFQFDLEGAGMPRLRLDSDRDLQSVDFRGGFPLTYGIGPWATKLGYYHLSSHAGDEFMVKNPAFQRVNYSRDAFVLGQSYYFTPSLRLYGEAEWAFYSDVSEPWAFQFGADFSPLCPTGLRGAPFPAINGHLREEVDFSGNVVVQAGWQWRSARNGQLLRMGLQYYNGKSNQFEFYNQNENKLGLGVWYDY